MNKPIISLVALMLALAVLAAIVLVGPWTGNTRATDSHDEVVLDDHHSDTVAAHEIYPGEVAEKIERGEDIVLLDVRTPEEYEATHLEGARLLPVQQLSAETLAAAGLGEEAKDKEIIIYCRSGARSETAYNIMHSLGYTNIKSVAGGMVHWEEDNYPFTASGPYDGNLSKGGGSGDGDLANDGPRLSLDRTLHDFGVIPQYGGTVSADFTITNSGDAPLELGELSTSCSCTTATVAESTVAPGEETTLTVVFDPDFHAEPLGVFKRTVFIPSNDPTTPEAEVTVAVDIAEGE